MHCRVAQTVDGVETRYVLDTSAGLSAGAAGGLPEVIVATTGGAGTYYVQIQGQILAQHQAGAWVYVLPDHLGSVRQLVDSGGQVALAQSYDPFGVPFEGAGSGTSEFGYTGEWWGVTRNSFSCGCGIMIPPPVGSCLRIRGREMICSRSRLTVGIMWKAIQCATGIPADIGFAKTPSIVSECSV
jgi:hypothetical protein